MSKNNLGFKSKYGINGMAHLELFGADGKLKEERAVENTITELGDAHVADQLADVPVDAQNGFMNVGTTSGGKTAASTGLEAALTAVALTSSTVGAGAADNDLIIVATFPAGTSTGALVEAGIFNLNDNTSLQCYAEFAVVNKLAADSMTITWTTQHGAS